MKHLIGVAIIVGFANPCFADLIVTSWFNHRALHFDDSGNYLGLFGSNLDGAWGVTLTPRGTILINEGFPTADILEFDLSGNFIRTFVAGGTAGLGFPGNMIFGPDGNLIVPDGFNSRVLKFDGTTGAFLGTLIPSGSNGLLFPDDVLLIGTSLYVSSDNASVFEFNVNTGAYIRTISDPRLGVPFGLLHVGNSLLVSTNDGPVHKVDLATGSYQGIFATGQNSRGMLNAADGTILVAFDSPGPSNFVARYATDGTPLGSFTSSDFAGAVFISQFSPAPEPSSIVLALVGAGSIGIVRGFRRKLRS